MTTSFTFKVKNLVGEERGSAMIEAAVVTPILIVLGLGIAEFGNILYTHHLIDTGVRDAARYLSRFDNPEGRENDARNIAITGSIAEGGANRVTWWDADDSINITYRDEPNGGRFRGPEPNIKVVHVEASVTYDGLRLGFLSLLGLGNSISFTIAHEERVIGE